jgi:glycosyltransferase involved in cell wall biosynthesis
MTPQKVLDNLPRTPTVGIMNQKSADPHPTGLPSCVLVSSPFSGNAVFFRRLNEMFGQQSGLRVMDPIWIEHRPAEALARLPPFRWNWTLASWIAASRRLRTLRRRAGDPAVVVFNQLNPLTFLGRLPHRSAIVLAVDATPMQVTAMGSHYLGRGARAPWIEAAKRSLYRQAYGRVTRFVALSESCRRSLVDDYGVDERRVDTIPPGVDLRRWTRPPNTNRSSDVVKVLFVGGDFERKGGGIVLRAAALDEFANCEFHIVSRGLSGPSARNVVIHDDVEPTSTELVGLYTSASLFVLPTEADFSPNSIVEAMAMGLPVISTSIGAISELVRNDETGFLVAAGDFDAFRSRLLELVQSASLRFEMGEAARRLAEEQHDLSGQIEQFAAIIRHACARDPQVGGRVAY